jgi:HSP20 family protein
MTLKEISPWRWGGLKRWDDDDRPYESFLQQMDTLHREMGSLFEDFWNGNGRMMHLYNPTALGSLTPQIDEIEDEKAIHIRVELPGMDKDDVDISLAEGMLTIKGEKKREEEEKSKDFYRKERSFGSFRRTLSIPVEVDETKIEASFKKGVLNIELPKTKAAQKKVKHISVKAA